MSDNIESVLPLGYKYGYKKRVIVVAITLILMYFGFYGTSRKQVFAVLQKNKKASSDTFLTGLFWVEDGIGYCAD